MVSPTSKNEQVVFTPVEYDPTVDLNNMTQYKPKNYRVSATLSKSVIEDSKANEDDAMDASSALEESSLADLSDYGDPEKAALADLEKSGLAHSDDTDAIRRKRRRRIIHRVGIFIVLSVIAQMYIPCYGM